MKVTIPNTPEKSFDPFYRYKRENLRIEKSGQFYNLVNLIDICKSLKVDVKDVMKYFQKALSQPVQQNKKTNIVQLKSIAKDPEEVLEEFIVEYVICKSELCLKPELELTSKTASGETKYTMRCKACAHISTFTVI